MGRNELTLIGEIEKTVSLLEEVRSFYMEIQQNELQQLGKTRATALIVAQVLENYYTCLETLFLRVSQYFENSLLKNKWHSDLLDKMILDIEGIRPPVVSSETYKNLRELMRFRHFKRYYFELDYDWKKLDYLIVCMEESDAQIDAELNNFKHLLAAL
jgi:hypothetical protein